MRTSKSTKRVVRECGGTWCDPHQLNRLKILSELQAEIRLLIAGQLVC